MFGVLLIHYNVAPNHIIASISKIGARCPQLFFIVSAFLSWTYLDKSFDKIDYLNFYKKRFFRIAPIYYLALLVALLLR